YQLWETADRLVLVNRRYQPIWERPLAGEWKPAKADEWIEGIVNRVFYYNDGDVRDDDLIDRLHAVLTELGLPVLIHKVLAQGYRERRARLLERAQIIEKSDQLDRKYLAEPMPSLDACDELLDWMNTRYCVLKAEGGKFRIRLPDGTLQAKDDFL